MLSQCSKGPTALAVVRLASAQSSALLSVNVGFELHQANSFSVRCSRSL